MPSPVPSGDSMVLDHAGDQVYRVLLGRRRVGPPRPGQVHSGEEPWTGYLPAAEVYARVPAQLVEG